MNRILVLIIGVCGLVGAAFGQESTLRIPDGARFTLFCARIEGADHVERSTRLKQMLLEKTDLRGWYVIHDAGAGSSTLYHGFYRSFDVDAPDRADRDDARRAQADRAKVEGLIDQNGQRIFARCLFQPLDAPDPDAPPEWNLTNVTGYWTIQIAAYTGGPERKQAAVESVRAARQMGIEAYYYHGPAVSSVCIGSWPLEAVSVQGGDVRATTDEVGAMVAVSSVPIAGNDKPVIDTVDSRGNKVRLYQPKAEIVDPSMKAVFDQYPEHSTNGYVDLIRVINKKTGQEQMIPKRPLVVEVPRKREGESSAGEAAPPVIDPGQRTRSRLRELGR